MTLNLFVRSTLLAALLVLASCAAGPGKDRPKGAAQAGWSNREAIGQAIHELNGGAVKAARKRLKQLLKRQPNDTVALSLMKQIDTPPQTLLGVENFAYTTREGDTMSELAKRFLGDPMLFYALARYNEIAAPGVLPSGRTLRIPGRARREPPTPTRRPPTTPEPRAPSERAPSESRAPVAARPTPPVRPAAPTVDRAGAVRLRAAGLEQMQRGQIDRAVALLTQASRLDPQNPRIRQDLDRASRIRNTVRARR